MARRTALLLATSLCLLTSGPPAEGQSDAGAGGAAPSDADAGVSAAAPADGTYALGDAAVSDEADRVAVDAVLRNLHPAMRDAFRAELTRLLRAPRSVGLSVTDGVLRVVEDGEASSAHLGAPAVRVAGPAGRGGQLRHVAEGGAYVATLETGNFRRVRRFVRSGDGLVVSVQLSSRLLPRPLNREARYVSRPVVDAGASVDAAP